jgi:hypothetical protein
MPGLSSPQEWRSGEIVGHCQWGEPTGRHRQSTQTDTLVTGGKADA